MKHNIPWQEGNREDGYLWGLVNLIHTLEAVEEETREETAHMDTIEECHTIDRDGQ